MDDFQSARTHMVDSQIRTNGVIDPRVIEAFDTLPREAFVPAARKEGAYTDRILDLGGQRFLMAPMVQARLVQALAPQPDEVALVIGAASGYSAAIFASLVTTVIALETRQALIDKATKNLGEAGVYNVAYIKGKLPDGAADQAPFSVIFLNGAVADVPQGLLDQLAVGGRLAAIVRSDARAVGQACIFVRHSETNVSKRVLFEVSMPYLSGFEPEEAFVF
jgi:protein-L-isoaspartate(D-aspartate) O-methyltransferase